MKLEDSIHDADTVYPGLEVVLSVHEAKEFKTIKRESRDHEPPDASNCSAVDYMIETIVMPVAERAAGIFPKSVFCEPAMEATA